MDTAISEDNLYCFIQPKNLYHVFEGRTIKIEFSTTCINCISLKRTECWKKIEDAIKCHITISIEDLVMGNKIYFSVKFNDYYRNIALLDASRDNPSLRSEGSLSAESGLLRKDDECDCSDFGDARCHKCCYCADHESSEFTDDFIDSFYDTNNKHYKYYGDLPTKSYLYDEVDKEFCIRNYIEKNSFSGDPDKINTLIKYLKYFAISTDFFDREIFRLNSKEAIFHRFMRYVNSITPVKSAYKI